MQSKYISLYALSFAMAEVRVKLETVLLVHHHVRGKTVFDAKFVKTSVLNTYHTNDCSGEPRQDSPMCLDY